MQLTCGSNACHTLGAIGMDHGSTTCLQIFFSSSLIMATHIFIKGSHPRVPCLAYQESEPSKQIPLLIAPKHRQMHLSSSTMRNPFLLYANYTVVPEVFTFYYPIFSIVTSSSKSLSVSMFLSSGTLWKVTLKVPCLHFRII